jgi:hypothetical protein
VKRLATISRGENACASPKATKTPDLSNPMSECNGHSAMTSVRFRRLQERLVKRLATISRGGNASASRRQQEKRPERSAKARTQLRPGLW